MSFAFGVGFICVLLFALWLERSYRVNQLQKEVISLKAKMTNDKDNHEEFSMRVSQMNSTGESFEESKRDPLTHLLGKKAFDDIFIQLLNQSKRFNKSFAVLMLKLDQFSEFNEANTSKVGDKLLIELASRIKPTVRQVDTVTRYAGDMFLLLMPNLSTPETAVYVAQRLLDHIVLPFLIEGKEFRVTACIGITIYPYDGDSIDTLLKNAGIALNKAKASGRNLFQFYQEETQTLGQRELSMKSSVASTDFLNQLTLDYLPYFNTETHEEVCLQAVPWLNHPQLGYIPFAEFFRIVQNAGKNLDLHEWVIRRSIAHFKSLEKLPTAPKQLLLTFNLKQIQTPELINKIFELVGTLEVNPQQIILEMVDDMDGIDEESLRSTFDELSQKGFQIAIGILVLGHFALKKITNLPIHYLKVDNKLIKEIDVHVASLSILERLLLIAHKMEIGVLTEGVEKATQKKLLQNMGCYVMQGKIISQEEGVHTN